MLQMCLTPGWIHERIYTFHSFKLFFSSSKMIGLVRFYGISIIVGYLMPNTLYTYTLNIYDLVWLGFMAYQSFLVI